MSDTALKIKLKLDTREANRSLEKLGEQCDGILEEFRNEAVEADSFKQVNAVVNELDKYSKSVSENLSKAKKELDSIVSQRGELEKSLGEKRRLGDTAGSNADTAKIKELNSQEKYLAQDIEDQKASLRETETLRSRIIAKEKIMLRNESQLTEELGEAEAKTDDAEAGIGRLEKAMLSVVKAAAKMKDFGGWFVKGIGTGLKGIGSGIFHGIGKVVTGAAGLVKKGFLGIIHHAKKFRDEGGSAIEGFARKASRIGLSLLGVRAVFAGLRKAVSSYLSDNQDVANRINSIWATLGNALGPIIEWVSNQIMSLLNLFSGLTKLLFGVEIKIKKATTASKGQAGALGDTAKNAKEAKRELAAFDEINKLSDTDSGSGSGGSGGGGGGGGSGFELISSDFAPWEELKNAIDAGDWVGVGKALADKVNEMLASVPWHDIGQSFGKEVDKIIKILYGFFENLDTKAIGGYVADFFNGALGSIDFDYAGRLLTRLHTMMYDAIIGFFTNLDAKLVGKSVGDFLKGVFNEFSEWFGKYDWSELGSSLYEGIKNFFAGADAGGVAESIATFFGKALKALGGLIGGFVKGAVDDIAQYFSKYVKDWDWNNNGQEIIAGILEGIVDAIAGIGKWLYDHVFKPFWDGIKGAFGIASPAKTMIEIGGYIIDGLFEGLTNAFEAVLEWLKSLPELFEKYLKLDVNFTEDIEGTQAALDAYYKQFGSENFDQEKFMKWYVEIYGKEDKTFTDTKKDYDSVKNKDSTATAKGSKAKNFTDTKSAFDALKSKDAWTNLKGSIYNNFKTLKKDNYDKVKSKDVWVTLKASVSSTINKVLSIFKKKEGGLYSGGRWRPIAMAAAGGSFNQGQLFIAREAGPELVGSLNGRGTAVMNNNQIVSSVAAGVSQAVAGVLSQGLVIRPRGATSTGGSSAGVFTDSFEMERFAEILAQKIKIEGGIVNLYLDGKKLAENSINWQKKLSFASNI